MTFAGLEILDDPKMATKLRKGFPFRFATQLAQALQISTSDFAKAVAIAPRTLARRKKQHTRFTLAESERALRLARIFVLAAKTLGNEESARQWLYAENMALGGEKPFDFLQTEPGAREVEKVLGRIAYGVYS